MSVRGGPRRVAEYDERDTYYREEAPPVRAPARTREREEIDIYSRRGDNRPAFLQDDYGRTEGGPLVLRQRETDTYARPPRPRSLSPVRRVTETREVVRRDRSPSPVRRVTESREVFRRERSPSPIRRVVESREILRRERSLSPVRSVVRERLIQRSPSPPQFREERFRERIVERESSMPPPPERLARRVVETREIRRERSPSPVRIRERIIERTRSPSPPPVERVRTRIVEREERRPSPPSLSPSPSPPPPIVRAPPIHQEIITHHRHIDHGFVSERVKAPSPPPPPRSAVGRSKETEIDIYTSRGNTEVDITKTTRNTSPEPPRRRRQEFYEEQDIYDSERDRLRVKDTQISLSRRRSVDSRPDFGTRERERERVKVDIRDDDDEAAYYARKNAERAYIGEAYNGATKDWSIVDVPPGTERVRMDGVGGGSEEITWQRYNGVRRSKFIPEREREPVRERERLPVSDSHSGSGRENTNMEISIRTDNRREGGGGIYEREYERIEETSGNMDRRVGLPRGPRNRAGDLWTEITKDLVIREAIEEMGYDFEETEYFFYVIEYLRYDDVRQLVELSDRIRRERQHRIVQIARERERLEKREREREAYDREREEAWRSTRFDKYDDERIIEREIVYDGRGGRRYR